jgi:hypothetical protein
MEDIMYILKSLMLRLLVAVFLMVPFNGYCMDIKRETIPIIILLQEGKAKISPDNKSILDETGNIIGKEASNTTINRPKPTVNAADTAREGSSPSPQIFYCNKKCAIITKHCYKDDNDNVICLNVCDKEALICE